MYPYMTGVRYDECQGQLPEQYDSCTRVETGQAERDAHLVYSHGGAGSWWCRVMLGQGHGGAGAWWAGLHKI